MLVQSKTRSEPEIPTASMADIAFLLIIFFLVTTNFIKECGLPMDLPNTESKEKDDVVQKKNVELYVARKDFLLNQQVVTSEKLLQELSKLTETAKEDSDRVVVLKCDKDAPYDRFIEAKDIMEKTGETFEDANRNGKYDQGERYMDANRNGRFDAGIIATIEVEDTKGKNVVDRTEIRSVDARGNIQLKKDDSEE